MRGTLISLISRERSKSEAKPALTAQLTSSLKEAVVSNVGHVIIVTEIAGRIVPRRQRVPLAVKPSLQGERSVFVELFSTIVSVN
jgi:hypothetical protein